MRAERRERPTQRVNINLSARAAEAAASLDRAQAGHQHVRYAAPAHGKESPEEKASRRAERREANLQAQMSPEKVRNLYFYYAN